ncbi:NAD-dependent epimerase [Candidatus Gottesmanbacteria bacterium RIFCSPLOWO2_01_FULL_39_12b]|uniref:NAD-dependent epimerase n=1 Tax=Candidatus Gottesmanbacteria bacterium RIFCSPLOWO2_01_FULL_39_12b TaxID=1798388 RepID=A0A1F6ANA3_9BACT|nr:MAG: NAD-dependent epimerase [Candidatus Gottesmanbacteria bacterium RIFCSPLOWO2_01_FULL_39_12b]
MGNFFKNKEILITGGLGFIGSNLAIRLVSYGARVTLVDSMIAAYGGNLFNIESIKEKVTVDFSDIRDTKKIEKLVKDKEFIFNLAGTLSHVDSMVDPMTDLEINCRAQLSLLESVRKFNPKARIIFAGTRNQYGKAKYLPVDENHPQEPTDINGINNIASEKYHLMYHAVYGIKTVSLRMTNTYGPRHQMKHERQGVLNWFIRKILDGEQIELYGKGVQIRDVNYVDDVVEAILMVAMAEKGWGEAYNLGGTPISLIDFVRKTYEVISSVQNKVQPCKEIVLKPYPVDRKKIEVGDYIASIEKIKKTYGWEPKTNLEEGIKKTILFYKKYRKYYW